MGVLDGKVAVVTGGTTGIGFAIARRLKREGASLVLLSERPTEEIDQACRHLSEEDGTVAGYRCDVRSREETKAIGEQVAERFGRIDILINNAGLNVVDTECADDYDAFKRLVDVNLHGVYNMILAVLPAMKAQRSGSIVNMSSGAAVRGVGGNACYSATKAAVLSLTETLPQELKGLGIRITAIGPGAVKTDMTAGVHTPQSDLMRQVRDHIADIVPSPDPSLEFMLDPENIANVAFWLCTDQSWGVNGTLVLVDHGLSNSWSAFPSDVKSLG